MRWFRWFRLPGRLVQNILLAAAIASFSVWLWPPERNYRAFLAPLYTLERLGYDTLFGVRGPQLHRVDPRLEVVGFDYLSEKDLGTRWPPPRSLHAQVIRNLKADGAKLIVYDVLFSGPSTPEADKELDAALKEAGNVVLVSRIDRDATEKRKSLEEPFYDDALGVDFLANARVGFAEVPTDDDGVVRRIVPTMNFQDQWLPSLAAAAYQTLNGLPEDSIKVETAQITLGQLKIPRSGPTVVDPVDLKPIPSAYVDFPGGMASFLMDTSFSEVVKKRYEKGRFKDKIVFVGLTGTQLVRESFDKYTTSYTRLTPELSGSLAFNEIPGVVVQAQLLNAMLTDNFVTHLPHWSVWTLVFGLTLLGAAAVRSSFNWRGPAVLFLCALVYTGYAIIAFRNARIHVPWTVPTMLMLSSVSLLAYLERGALRRKWSAYVSPAVLEQILRHEGEATAHRCIASVVFGDIRGFTAFTNKTKPETVVSLLNMHFERITSIVYAQQGTIDKFLGDGVMVLFGVPVSREDGALRAVRAAWQMCEASKQPLEFGGQQYVLDSGFGVTTGPLIAGHVGSKARHDYTVIGDVVNLAARLQGVTGEPDVVIDAATYALVRPYVDVESLGEVTVKGMPEPIPCYRVTAWRDVPDLALKPVRKARIVRSEV